MLGIAVLVIPQIVILWNVPFCKENLTPLTDNHRPTPVYILYIDVAIHFC